MNAGVPEISLDRANTSLHSARRDRNDEFYTQRTDIENELKHYKNHFKGKVVYCNCDDPRVSEFTKFFLVKFRDYGLRKLIATCYRNTNPDLFTSEAEDHGASIMVADAESAASGGVVETLDGNGDFRSFECVGLLKQADIVVTNPPFSLFREYVAQLIKHEKKFLIIGNKNAITYKEIFPLIKENKMWIGSTPMSKDLLFDVPEIVAKELKEKKKKGSSYKIIDGVIKGRSQSIWFTNLNHKRRQEELMLCERYHDNPQGYPKYDNYDAIEVGKTKLIPEDYFVAMGVPITFLDKYCPEQFEILDANDYRLNPNKTPYKSHGLIKDKDGAIRGKPTYARIVIRRRRQT